MLSGLGVLFVLAGCVGSDLKLVPEPEGRAAGWDAGLDPWQGPAPWVPGSDLLCLYTDGLVDQRGGEGFSEERLLAGLAQRRGDTPDAIVRAVFQEADKATPHPADDRTLLVLRA